MSGVIQLCPSPYLATLASSFFRNTVNVFPPQRSLILPFPLEPEWSHSREQHWASWWSGPPRPPTPGESHLPSKSRCTHQNECSLPRHSSFTSGSSHVPHCHIRELRSKQIPDRLTSFILNWLSSSSLKRSNIHFGPHFCFLPSSQSEAQAHFVTCSFYYPWANSSPRPVFVNTVL